MVDMDNKNLVEKIYKENKPELIIDLKFNKTLSEERKKLENNTIPYAKNIIILYIDSISRAYSIRQLKKTLHFFEQFMTFKRGYNKNYPTENYHSFQFFKYLSFKGYNSHFYNKNTLKLSINFQ